jgi:hypothetical protein
VATLALEMAGAALPPFFAQGKAQVLASVSDPDLFREKSVPLLREQESPEHHFDLERLSGAVPPTNRYALVALCAERKLDPAEVGLLPYAVVRWTEALAMSLCEHRQWPSNAAIQAKCLVYAGLLAHYAGDLTHPLHVTAHFDGRMGSDGKVFHTGIHNRADALLQKVPPDSVRPLAACPAPFADLPASVFGEIARAHALVERVYALDSRIPRVEEPLTDAEVRAFAAERLRAATAFLAALYRTAWERSAVIPYPAWHQPLPAL